MNIESLIEEKLAGDVEFQNSLQNLSDDEKTNLITEKRNSILLEEAPKWYDESKKNEKAYIDTKTRAERAEQDLKKFKPADVNKDEDSLSTKDIYAFMEAKVPQDDIDDVVDYAKMKGISIGDALKSSVVKAVLADKQETRKTAEATQTRSTRATTKIDGNTILQNAREKGEDALPTAGSSEAEDMFWARRGGRR